MKSNGILTKELLVKLYIVQRKSILKVAHEMGFPSWTILYWMKKFGIKRRSCNAYPIWNKGLTKETDERMRKNTESFCRTMKKRYPNGTRGHLGKSHSADTKKKMSLRRLGKTYEDIYGKNADLMRERRGHELTLRWNNESYREKMCGRTPWNKGLTKNDSSSIMRLALGRLGEKNPMYGKHPANFKNYVRFEPYGPEFNQDLKQRIRERDDFVCKICGITEKQHIENIGRILTVHHIDGNKENNTPSNLISLCMLCHAKLQSEEFAHSHSLVNFLASG